MNLQLNEKLLLFFGLLFLSCNVPSADQSNSPPNIIFIMADNHTTQGFGVYGSRFG